MSFKDMTNCSYLPLPEVLSFIVDNRGKTVPTTKTGIPLIATNCIKNNELYPVFEKIRYLSEDTYKNWFRAHPIPGDIIFVNKGAPGTVCLVPDPVGFCIAQDMMAFRVNEKIINNKYLLAVLRSPQFQTQIEQFHVGTLIPHFKKSDLDKLLIPIPFMNVQNFIGKAYYELCSKIELNNRINKILEEMAQTIFKSWFVDFEPFQDGGFEDSELGRIPKGWRVGTLEECIISIDNRGKTPPLATDITQYPIIDVKALSGEYRAINYNNCTKYVEEETYNNWFRSGHPKEQDILVSTVGSLAEMKLFYGDKGCIAQNVVGFRSKNISPLYLYQYLKYIKEDLISYDIGTVQPSIKVTHIIKHKVLIPCDNDIKLFESAIKEISDMIFKNFEENQILSTIREKLLQKLMSGEIRVPIEGGAIDG